MQVERPSRIERINSNRIVTTHPKSNTQHQQQKHTSASSKKTQHIDANGDSTSDNNDTIPSSPRYRVQQTNSARKQQQPKRLSQGEYTMDHSDQHQNLPNNRECHRVTSSSSRSSSKRTIRPQQGLQLDQAQRYPVNDFATQCSTSPRVTTTVKTPTSPLSKSSFTTTSNVTVSASEQDEVELWGLPSPGWKRARVQTGSRENLVAETSSSEARSPQESGRNGDNSSSSNSRRGNRIRIPQPEVAPNEIMNGGAECNNASDEERENRREIREVLANSLGSIHPPVTLINTSGAGSRRSSNMLHHFHNCNHHQHQHYACDSNASNSRSNRHTHTRNFSSPSLLDSFTSPEPMLSPIQSYFGSDPNSPASSFSLPRHDHYPRLTVDPSASMDGYHGFATQPWSEQSSTPSRAYSHRWTRRLSQSDAYEDHNNKSSVTDSSGDRSTRQGRSNTATSRAFAPSAIDQPWDAVITDTSISRASDEMYEGEQDLAPEETMHDSDDEEVLDEGESYQRRYRSLDLENNTEDGYLSDEDDVEAHFEQDMHEVDDDDEMGEATHVQSSYHSQDGTIPRSSSQPQWNGALSQPSTTSVEGEAQAGESDEALARRLQEEEYTAMLGERDAYATFSGVISRFRSRRISSTSSSFSPSSDRYRFGDEFSPAIERQYYLPQELTSGSGIRDREISRSSDNIRLSRRMSASRSAFISSYSLNSSRYSHERDRETARERSRSPPTYQSLSARLDAAEREHRALVRAFDLRFNSRMLGRLSIWGNPADYMNDDQVDDSYEGLLRLSEQIGDAKPKGVSADTLKMMDKHVVSWRSRKEKAKPLESSSTGTSASTSSSPSLSEDSTPYSVYSQSPYAVRPVTRSHGLNSGMGDATSEDPIEEK
ncbi:hypothetical protein BGZ49_010381 [Haplosporangium sp. Z 27]|nr:hypothetical protein BGZ49_010381 [Haplosporangium sp. Z 27]